MSRPSTNQDRSAAIAALLASANGGNRDEIRKQIEDLTKEFGIELKDIRDDENRTLLHVVAPNNGATSFEILQESGIELDLADNDQNTALHLAVRDKNEEFCKLMLQHGANFLVKNKEGKTALDLIDKDDQQMGEVRQIMLNNAVENFAAQQKLDEVYPGRVDEIKCDLLRQWDANPRGIEDSKKQLTRILDQRRSAEKHYRNAVRQEREIRTFELNPGANVDDQTHNPTHILSKELFGLSREEKMEWVANREAALAHTREPGQEYRALVFDTKIQNLDEVNVANTRFFSFVKNDREPTVEQIAEAKKFDPNTEALKRNAVSAVAPLIDLAKWAGRGIFSSSDVTKDQRYQKFLTLRNQLFSNLKYKIGQGGEIHLNSIKKLQKMLEDSGGLLDESQFADIQKEIAKEIAELEKIDAKELEEINKRMSDMNRDMLGYTNEKGERIKGLVDHLREEDERWPFIAFQIALLVTPFAGFSFLALAGSTAAPMFTAGMSFGQGVGGVMANIPIIGDIAHAIRLDFAVQWLLDNVPIVNNFSQIFGLATNNAVTQNLFEGLAPALGSELLGLGLAGMFFGEVLAPKIFELNGGNYKSSKLDLGDKFAKAQEEAMKKKFAELEANNPDEFGSTNVKIGDKKPGDLRKEEVNKALESAKNAAKNYRLKTLHKKIESLAEADLAIFHSLKLEGEELAEKLKTDRAVTVAKLTDPLLVAKLEERVLARERLGTSFDPNQFVRWLDADDKNIPTLAQQRRQQILKDFTKETQDRIELARFIHSSSPQELREVFGDTKLTYQQTRDFVYLLKNNKDKLLRSLANVDGNDDAFSEIATFVLAYESVGRTPSFFQSAEREDKKVTGLAKSYRDKHPELADKQNILKLISRLREDDFVIFNNLKKKMIKLEKDTKPISLLKEEKAFPNPSDVLEAFDQTDNMATTRKCADMLRHKASPHPSVKTTGSIQLSTPRADSDQHAQIVYRPTK